MKPIIRAMLLALAIRRLARITKQLADAARDGAPTDTITNELEAEMRRLNALRVNGELERIAAQTRAHA